ncbi:IS3 family transposase [Lysinibacillus sp. FSL H8-0500]|uniref:IS3 family transposase n=1 Tax=Lysinibacillus sp. FSL H8-0500 TaxID=2921393 RepID=UPI003101A0AF
MRKYSFSKEEKLEILNFYENSQFTLNEVAELYKVDSRTIKDWQNNYLFFGEDILNRSKHHNTYPKELKLAAVQDYISGSYSLRETVRKYRLSGTTVLRNWIKKYTSHSELKDSGKGMSKTMTKGRKTTVQERIEIAQACIANGKKYQVIAEQYAVSYQQVYQWVKKFEQSGELGLQDRRGLTKLEEELSTEDKFRLELQRMERENERLRAEKSFLKKVRGNRKEASLSQIRLQQRYVAIQEVHQEEKFSILLLCKIAGVSRAAYYKWLNRKPSNREVENEAILNAIHHLYQQVEGIYGYRRTTLTINRQRKENHQMMVNKKRIYRLMKMCRLKSVIRRKRKKYRKSNPDYVAENILSRKFEADLPNQKWCTDVTEFKYGNGKKAYLSAIIDLYDNSIVSYVLGHSNNNKLVFQTMTPAIQKLKEDEHPLIHSDRGYQYTSKLFKQMIDDAGIVHSMSRVGRCIDNGPIEAFWGTLKCEKYYLNKYDTYEALKKAIVGYISFYNSERYQEKLNGLSPLEFRDQAA